MKLVAYGPKEWSLIPTPADAPTVPSGCVLLKPLAVGICGSDYKMYCGSDFYWGSNGRCKRGGVVVGHEFVGEIVAIAPDLVATHQSTSSTEHTDNNAFNYSSFKPGQLVCVEQAVQCCSPGDPSPFFAATPCWHCQNGGKNKCDKLTILGQGADGGASTWTILQHPHLHPVPLGISAEQAVLAEPLAVSVHAVDRVTPFIDPSTSVVCVSGGGMVGLGIIAALRHAHPSCRIILLEPLEFKRVHALKMGVNAALAPTAPLTNLEPTLQTLVDARGGVDIFFEASGNPASLQLGFHHLRKRGVLCHVGIFKDGNVSLDFNLVSAGKELTIVGSSLGRGAWGRSLEIIKNGGMAGIVTHKLALSDWQRGIALVDPDNDAERETEKCIKVILDPQGL